MGQLLVEYEEFKRDSPLLFSSPLTHFNIRLLSMVISLATKKLQPKSKGFHSKYSLETQVQKHRKLHYFQDLNIIRSTQICASYFRTHLSKEV